MAGSWKLRKDKLKEDAPVAPETQPPSPAETPEDDVQMPVFDLSGNAFRTQQEEEPLPNGDEPRFLDDDSPSFLPESQDEPTLEPIALGEAEPIAPPVFTPSEPESPRHSPAEDVIATPFHEDDPLVEPSEPLQPDVIALAPEPPPVIAPEPLPAVFAPEPPTIAPEAPAFTAPAAAPEPPSRDVIARSLVRTDDDMDIPRVAPFITEAPAPPPEADVERTHHIVLRLGNLAATFPLTKEVTTIGRPDGVVQNYPDIEVELDDGVSRRHAQIRREGTGFVLVDVGSTNGTRLNGENLVPNEPAPLHAGDRIHIGERTELQFE